MGRPRKRTKASELSAFEKHPERKRERANEPKPDGPIGPPPPHWVVEKPPSRVRAADSHLARADRSSRGRYHAYGSDFSSHDRLASLRLLAEAVPMSSAFLE
jgi:hypothetical protein